MRLAGLFLSLLLLAAGMGLGIVYPSAMENRPGREIGRWTVHAGGHAFIASQATLMPSDGGTLMTVTIYASAPLHAPRPLHAGEPREVLILSVLDGAGRLVSRESLGFPDPGILESPHTGILRFRQQAAVLPAASGSHSFVVEAGRDFYDTVLTVELVLNAAIYRVRSEAKPVGRILMVAGAVGLFVSARGRRNQPSRSAPPPPKWGRAGQP